ncbi:hypothetical protein [Sporosarcina koreensis]|nr:hypothetical protein [Sporosarcina koreensis]
MIQIIHLMATVQDHKRITQSNQNNSGTLRIQGLRNEEKRLNGR